MSPRLASLAIACFLCAATLFGSQTAPYAVLDNIEDDWVNLHPVPTRPMTITDDSQDAYVLNAQLDTIVHFNARPGLDRAVPAAGWRTRAVGRVHPK